MHRQINHRITNRDSDARTNISVHTEDLNRERDLQDEQDDDGNQSVVAQKSHLHCAFPRVEEIPQSTDAESRDADGGTNLHAGDPEDKGKHPYSDEDSRSCYREQKIIKIANETACAQDRTKGEENRRRVCFVVSLGVRIE